MCLESGTKAQGHSLLYRRCSKLNEELMYNTFRYIKFNNEEAEENEVTSFVINRTSPIV
jgi:hypothetical protein